MISIMKRKWAGDFYWSLSAGFRCAAAAPLVAADCIGRWPHSLPVLPRLIYYGRVALIQSYYDGCPASLLSLRGVATIGWLVAHVFICLHRFLFPSCLRHSPNTSGLRHLPFHSAIHCHFTDGGFFSPRFLDSFIKMNPRLLLRVLCR